MRSYRYLHFDVFTDQLFGGNQLAVFLDGRGLATAVMQQIAIEMNFAESTFVMPAEAATTDVRVRIFTPGEELPMAGHPVIGTAFALSRAGVLRPDHSRVVFGLGVGPTPIELQWTGDDLSFAWMTQPAPSFGPELNDRAAAAAALGLAETALAESPLQVVSCGVPYLIVPLRTRADVDAGVLDAQRHHTFSEAHGLGTIAVYLFTLEPGSDRATTYNRMFAPHLGIREDAATGSAAGPLGCYLVRHRLVPPEHWAAMRSRQGVRMKRPSDLHLAIDQQGSDIVSVRVGGTAVLAGEGTLYI